MADKVERPTPEPQRQYLSPLEFSARTGLSPATVRRYLKQGKLRYLQPAGPRGRILIPAEALESIVAVGSGITSAVSQPSTGPACAQSQRHARSARLSGPPPLWTRKLGSPSTGEE